MASIKRYVHPVAKPIWSPLKAVAPDLTLNIQPTAGENGDSAPVPMALAFVDPDQEIHIYIFDDAGRKALVELLLGGIVLPA